MLPSPERCVIGASHVASSLPSPNSCMPRTGVAMSSCSSSVSSGGGVGKDNDRAIASRAATYHLKPELQGYRLVDGGYERQPLVEPLDGRLPCTARR